MSLAVEPAEAVPTVLFPEARARTRRRRRRNLLIAALVLALVIAVVLWASGRGSPAKSAQVGPGTNLPPTAGATVMSVGTYYHASGRSPELCFVVLDSLPPQCGVHVSLQHTTDKAIPGLSSYNGVAFSSGRVTIYGTYASGTLTVVRVVAGADAMDVTTPTPHPPPAYRVVDVKAAEAIQRRLIRIPGVVASSFDDRSNRVTVMVIALDEATRAALSGFTSDEIQIVPMIRPIAR